MTQHVIQMSGGIGSFCAAVRVAERHGADNMTLLFADTQVEDEDLYRFLRDAAAFLDAPLVTVADGRTPFEVYADVRFIGNSRVAPCSRHLKQVPCRKWLTDHVDPGDSVLYVGIDWTERRRTPAITAGWQPWRVEYPMCDEPHLTKQQMIEQCRRLGITPPRLYALGFSHNNCGGVCVRAGQKQWRHLLKTFPDRFADAEAREEALRAELGNVSILRQQTDGARHPLPLSELRRRVELTPPLFEVDGPKAA